MCGGGGRSVSSMADEKYEKRKKNYGDLPSLAVGDKVERKPASERMKDVKVSKGVMSARSLLMPFGMGDK
tara:strand:+ start:581 stop:790 length:210 start_codon:yes stop_codon:yes gene_type:complete